jgi:hypothetical protein
MSRVKLLFYVTYFLLVSLGMLSAQKPAGPNRPAAVPSDYVITPFGYFHPSCVRVVPSGATLLADGRVQFANGAEETVASFCSFPHYTPAGALVVDGTERILPFEISWSWIEAGQVSTSNTYDGVMATWTVPRTPTTNDGQTLFFFPSLSHSKSTPPAEEPIIQPVLGWNDGQSGAGPWNIASWNCCPGGMTWSSDPVTVNPGDQIRGSVLSACGSITIQSCSKWNITTQDVTTGQSTILHSVFSSLLKFPWAQSGVLEVYNINRCSDYPPDGAITFSNVSLFDNLFRRITSPGWSPQLFVTQGQTDPWCNYGVTTTDSTVTLTY